MKRYIISFDDGTMNIPDEDLEAVGAAAHAVVAAAQSAGVWIFGGGLHAQQASIVDIDGAIRLGEFPETKAVLGGFSLVEVATHEEALEWARQMAAACRCPQEVREIMYDPLV